MKKTILFIILLTFTFLSNAQESDVPDYASEYSKGYIAIGLGAAFPGGEGLEDYNVGINLKFLDVGYRFTQYVGLTFGIDSSGLPFADSDIDAAIGIARFSVGPMFTVPYFGSGFVFANSIVFKLTKGFTLSIDLDYSLGKFNKVKINDGDSEDIAGNNLNIFTSGIGVRYNF